MKESIQLCYIDDMIDLTLTEYLVELCENLNASGKYDYSFDYVEYPFKREDSYKTLIESSEVNNSNIIIIDSKLFENGNLGVSKLTGEKFTIILRKFLPFIKTIVISSKNERESDTLTMKKYQSHDSQTSPKDFYDNTLKEILMRYIVGTIEEFEVLEEINEDDEIDRVLISSIESTISGIVNNNLFEKNDLDELINLFKEVKERYGD